MKLNLQQFASGSTKGGRRGGRKSGSKFTAASRRFSTRGRRRKPAQDTETPW